MKRWLGALVAVIALTTGLAPAELGAVYGRADAATVNHAAVIVDDGGRVTKTVISFTGESVSGIEALQLAGQAPTVRGFSGLGAAVCAIRTVGCSAGNDCLTCGGDHYWAYFRAPSGTRVYTKWPAGAGATRVRNGDVEGWHWSAGTPPPFATVEEIGIPDPPATTTAPPAPVTTPSEPAGAGGGVGGGSPPAGGATTSVPASAISAPAEGATTAPAASSTAPDAARAQSGARSDGRDRSDRNSGEGRSAVGPHVAGSDEGGGTGTAVALFAAVLAAIVAGYVFLRRRRARIEA